MRPDEWRALGLGLFTPLALAGTVFYLMHHIVVKTNLFLVGGIVKRLGGTLELGSLGGLYRARPGLALLFLVPALSLAGIPPLSGFWGKLVLVKAGLDSGHYAVTAIALAVSLLTLFSMTKIWGNAFWGAPAVDTAEGPRPPLPPARRALMVAPTAALVVVSLAIAVLAGPLYDLSERAAQDLLDPSAYVEAVFEP